MTGRLQALFAPESIAVIGAATRDVPIRGVLLHLLRHNGYRGALHPVNPTRTEIDGLPCVPAIGAIGRPVDLAIIVSPAAGVPRALAEAEAAGARFAVIISSGFAEEGDAGAAAQKEIAAVARRGRLRVVGPNAEGFHNVPLGIAATFSPTVEPRAGGIAEIPARRIGVVAQSGGMGFALYDRGRALGLPFSLVATTGNECDITAADVFDHLVDDPETGVILMFLESVRDGRGFLAAARRARAAGKPVVALKVGRSVAGTRAAASHTASLAGWNTAYRAAFESTGVFAAADPDEAIAAAAAFATLRRASGRRCAVVTLSGGAGAAAADVLEEAGLVLPPLPEDLQARLRVGLPSYGATANPVDVTAQALATGAFLGAIETLANSDAVDLVAVCATLAPEARTVVPPADVARLRQTAKNPVLWHSYSLPSRFGQTAFAGAGEVVHAGLRGLAVAARALTTSGISATVGPAPVAAARTDALDRAIAGRRGTLSEHDAKAALAAAGLPMPAETLVPPDGDVASAASALGFPVALKIQSADIPHKTEVGGVALGLADAGAVSTAWAAMRERVTRARPAARIDGVLVAPMARAGLPMIAGVFEDAQFGKLVMVGAGGVAVEVSGDVAWRLAPVDDAEALAMLRTLRCWPLLDGFRGAPPQDAASFARLVADLSTLAVAADDRIAEVELNPVLLHEEGLTVIDALMSLKD